jgi:acetyl-CoA carboxylase carboxyltransferase component
LAVGCQPKKSGKTKNGEMQFGGVIYSDSADKATDLLPIATKRKFL